MKKGELKAGQVVIITAHPEYGEWIIKNEGGYYLSMVRSERGDSVVAWDEEFLTLISQ